LPVTEDVCAFGDELSGDVHPAVHTASTNTAHKAPAKYRGGSVIHYSFAKRLNTAIVLKLFASSLLQTTDHEKCQPR
jgi:hypothetical protein